MTIDLYKKVKEYVDEKNLPNEILIDGMMSLVCFSIDK